MAVGILQVLIAILGGANLGLLLSPWVVHGMLAAIGVIIMAKQLHTLLGVMPESIEPLDLILELPRSFLHANPKIAFIGITSLALLYLVPRMAPLKLRKVPAPLFVLLLAITLSLIFHLETPQIYKFAGDTFDVGPKYLIHLPSSFLDAFFFPDFSTITSFGSLKFILLFVLVGSIESVLSVLAVDALDREKRSSNLNRDLLSVGIGNTVAAFVGGLPMISEIVRSKANIDAGAKSSTSNFVHGALFLLFVVFLPGVLGLIPLAALASLLVFTGMRLASPHEFESAFEHGKDQLLLFLTTFVLTITVDLLVGVLAGMSLKVVMHWIRLGSLSELFSSKARLSYKGDCIVITYTGAATFLQVLNLRKALARAMSENRTVIVDLSKAKLIDHTFQIQIEGFMRESLEGMLRVEGLEGCTSCGMMPNATKIRRSDDDRAHRPTPLSA